MQAVACGGCSQPVVRGQPAVSRGAVIWHRTCAWRSVLATAKAEIVRLKNALTASQAEVVASRNEALEFRRQRDAAVDDLRKGRAQLEAAHGTYARELVQARSEIMTLQNERWQLTQELANRSVSLPPPAATPVSPPPTPPPPPPRAEPDERDATEIRFSLLDLD